MKKIKKLIKEISQTKFFWVVGVGFILAVFFILSLPQPGSVPQQVRVANVTDTSLSLSWTTEKSTLGGVVLTTEKNRFLRSLGFFLCHYFSFGCVVYPDEIGKGTTHFVVLKNLKPKTSYYYRIYSGGKLWKYDFEGKILPKIETSEVLPLLNMPNPIYSMVLRGEKRLPVAGALVYISLLDGQNRNIIKSQPLITYTDKKGIWLADLGNLRSFDLLEPVRANQNDLLFVKVWTPQGEEKAEFIQYNQTKAINPIIL